MSAGFLIGWVWMQRSIGMPSCCRRSTSALVATSKPPPQAAIVDSTAGMRQRLHRVVQPESGQLLRQQPVRRGDPVRLEHQQRGAVLGDESRQCPASRPQLVTQLRPS